MRGWAGWGLSEGAVHYELAPKFLIKTIYCLMDFDIAPEEGEGESL